MKVPHEHGAGGRRERDNELHVCDALLDADGGKFVVVEIVPKEGKKWARIASDKMTKGVSSRPEMTHFAPIEVLLTRFTKEV